MAFFLGNIDQCRTTDGAFFEGVSLRLFDLTDQRWRIYWVDSTGARLFPPVVGSFDGPDGVFRGEDSHEGQPVLVTFRWDRRDPTGPTWQQGVTTVRAWDGAPSLSNEPFARLRAPLAGFGVIEAADLGEAAALVAYTPCARAAPSSFARSRP